MCSASRVLIVAAIAGMIVTDLNGNQILGWMVAAVAGLLVFLGQRRYSHAIGGTCQIARRARSSSPGEPFAPRTRHARPDPAADTSPLGHG
jgi:hypothetical protein